MRITHAINRSRKISGSEMNGNFANLGERVQRSEPVNCCYTRVKIFDFEAQRPQVSEANAAYDTTRQSIKRANAIQTLKTIKEKFFRILLTMQNSSYILDINLQQRSQYLKYVIILWRS